MLVVEHGSCLGKLLSVNRGLHKLQIDVFVCRHTDFAVSCQKHQTLYDLSSLIYHIALQD